MVEITTIYLMVGINYLLTGGHHLVLYLNIFKASLHMENNNHDFPPKRNGTIVGQYGQLIFGALLNDTLRWRLHAWVWVPYKLEDRNPKLPDGAATIIFQNQFYFCWSSGM